MSSWTDAIAKLDRNDHERVWTPKGFFDIGYNPEYQMWTAGDGGIICYSAKSKKVLCEKLSD